MVINQKWFVIKRGLYNIRFSKQAIGGYTYHDETWKADGYDGIYPYLDGPVRAINQNDTSGADIGLFMSKDFDGKSAMGVSTVSFLCSGVYSMGKPYSYVQKPAPSINEKQSNILKTAKVNNHLI